MIIIDKDYENIISRNFKLTTLFDIVSTNSVNTHNPIVIKNNLVFKMPDFISNRDRQLYSGKVINRYNINHFRHIASTDLNNFRYIITLLKIEELLLKFKTKDILPLNTVIYA